MHRALMIPRRSVSLLRRWAAMLLVSLWMPAGFVSGTRCERGAVCHPSREDVLLLKDEPDPKCFTRKARDFTCFFKTADNRTYDLFYSISSLQRKKRCEMSVQRLEEGTFLHVYSIPSSDVFLFVDMHVEVMEHDSNTSVCERSISVEDHFLLDPPSSVSLLETGQVGQLLVSWHPNIPSYAVSGMYRIRYSSRGLGEKTKEINDDKRKGDILGSLVPGEETEVQLSVKAGPDSSAGHWSSWSRPERAVVPQSADDVSLMCYTSDLQNVTCQWDGSRYGCKLFYKFGLSEEWTECPADGAFTDLCRFQGDESRKVRVKLSSAPPPLNRTFYAAGFFLNKTIKTSPPGNLTGVLTEKDKLCLKWEAPLPSLWAHLQYEVGYRTTEREAWMTVSVEGPETHTCLEVLRGSLFDVKVRAKPNGSMYSGFWSDWSEVLTGHATTDTGLWLMLCIPVSILITAILLISTYLSKLKQYFWPPVPNLDKVLQSFLTEFKGQRWDPPITSKQCPEETTASVVEIMSHDNELSGGEGKEEESTQLLSPAGAPPGGEQGDGGPGTKGFPDYVTLNKDSTILCPEGNKYLYEAVGEKRVPGAGGEFLNPYQCSCSNVCAPPRTCNDFNNCSYLALADGARGPGNLYTNLPCI